MTTTRDPADVYATLRRLGEATLPMTLPAAEQKRVAGWCRRAAKADGFAISQYRDRREDRVMRHARPLRLFLVRPDGTGTIVRPDAEKVTAP